MQALDGATCAHIVLDVLGPGENKAVTAAGAEFRRSSDQVSAPRRDSPLRNCSPQGGGKGLAERRHDVGVAQNERAGVTPVLAFGSIAAMVHFLSHSRLFA